MNTDLAKAVLYVYPMMKKLAEATRVGARNKALLSYRSRCDALHDLEAVAQEVLLAQRLDDLSELIDALLEQLNQEELFLLEYRYFRRRKALAQLGSDIACSERNYFRKQERLAKKVASYLFARGITTEYFFTAFKSCTCLMKVYNAVANGAEKKICARREQREITFHGSNCSGGEDLLPRATNTAITSTATAVSVINTIWTAERLPALFSSAADDAGSGR